jgi:hypothetical protein
LTAAEQDPREIGELQLPNLLDLLFPQSLPFDLTIQDMVLLFLTSGIAIMTAITFILKARKNRILNRKEDSLKKYAENNWKKVAWPDSFACLMKL